MERPELTEVQIAANNVKLAELSKVATELYGPDAQFAYTNKEDKLFIMSFDDAIQACGRHIASEPVDKVLHVLAEFRENFERAINSPYGEILRQRGEANARQKLAERALAAE